MEDEEAKGKDREGERKNITEGVMKCPKDVGSVEGMGVTTDLKGIIRYLSRSFKE